MPPSDCNAQLRPRARGHCSDFGAACKEKHRRRSVGVLLVAQLEAPAGYQILLLLGELFLSGRSWWRRCVVGS